MDAIYAEALTKTYGDKNAVDNINLIVPKGSIYGFIGRNGAGKTTTQKMVCGLARPSAGTVSLFGNPIGKQSVRKQVGVLIEQPALYPELSAYENLVLQGLNIGISDPKKQAHKSLEMVELTDAAEKKSKQLSLGMRQRLGVAVAMMGSPKLLVLDEPINGLDPQGIIEMRGIFERMNKEMGITIFISSHILGELSRIATHYGIIHDGRLIQQISAKELSEQSRDYLFVKSSDNNKAKKIIDDIFSPTECSIHDDGLHIFGGASSRDVNEALWNNGIAVDAVYLHQQDLEEYFLRLMGGIEYA